MASSDSDESNRSTNQNQRRSRSRSGSRNRSRSRSRSRNRSSRVDASTMTDPSIFKKKKSRKKSLPLERHLMENYYKFIKKIPNTTSTLWIGSEDPNEKYRNLPRKPFCTGINQLCRERDPVTKKYIKVPDDGSENDVYDMVIYHQYPKKKKKKKTNP